MTNLFFVTDFTDMVKIAPGQSGISPTRYACNCESVTNKRIASDDDFFKFINYPSRLRETISSRI